MPGTESAISIRRAGEWLNAPASTPFWLILGLGVGASRPGNGAKVDA